LKATSSGMVLLAKPVDADELLSALANALTRITADQPAG
jgi:hypothetical protein